MKLNVVATRLLALLTICTIPLVSARAFAVLIPVQNGEPFGTLLNPALNPDFATNIPAPPVVNDTDNPVTAVYDSEANVTWISDQHLFQEQYNSNPYFLSTLVGNKVTDPDGTQHTITANDFWWQYQIERELASLEGTVAWINSLNSTHYLGTDQWSLPLVADAASLWNQLTATYPPNPASGGAPCSFLKTIGFSGCGYYDDNVGPFTYVLPTGWTADRVGRGKACYYNISQSTPNGDLADCHNLDEGLEATAIVPGYTGTNQASAPGTNIEFFSNPNAVVRCNIFGVKVPNEPAGYGSCRRNPFTPF